MGDVLITVAIWSALAIGAWMGARQLDRAFQLHGDYHAGPRPYPDQDPPPHATQDAARTAL